MGGKVSIPLVSGLFVIVGGEYNKNKNKFQSPWYRVFL